MIRYRNIMFVTDMYVKHWHWLIFTVSRTYRYRREPVLDILIKIIFFKRCCLCFFRYCNLSYQQRQCRLQSSCTRMSALCILRTGLKLTLDANTKPVTSSSSRLDANHCTRHYISIYFPCFTRLGLQDNPTGHLTFVWSIHNAYI